MCVHSGLKCLDSNTERMEEEAVQESKWNAMQRKIGACCCVLVCRYKEGERERAHTLFSALYRCVYRWMNKREPRTLYVLCIYPSISLSWSSSSSQTGRSGHDKRARRDEKVQDWSMTRLEKKNSLISQENNNNKIPPPPSFLSVAPLRPRCCLHYTRRTGSLLRAAQEYLEEKCLLKPIAGPLF